MEPIVPEDGPPLAWFLGVAIRDAREARGMTQRALGIAAGVHPMAISKIERGIQADVGIAILERIARGLATQGAIRTTDLVETAEHAYRREIVLSPAAFGRMVELIENPSEPTPKLIAPMSEAPRRCAE